MKARKPLRPDSFEEVKARVEQAMVRGVNAPACMASVAVADLRRLLTRLEQLEKK